MSPPTEKPPTRELPDPAEEVLLDEPVNGNAEYKVRAVTPLYVVEADESGQIELPTDVFEFEDEYEDDHNRLTTDEARALLFALNPAKRAGSFIKAIGHQVKRNKALGDLRSSDTSHDSDREPEKVLLPYNGHEHLFVVTHPITGATDTKIAWFKPGLSEMADAGSAKRLHMEFARRNPELLVITEATKGISHSGKTVELYDLAGRNLETMAAESLHFVRHFSNDGERETELYGTSLGTVLEANMLAANIAANPHAQQNINTAFFIASAVIACEVDPSEDFRGTDLSEEAYRKLMKKRFRNHIVPDLIQMAVNNPGDIVGSKDNIGTFLFAPEKAMRRLATIRKDYENVNGVPWSMIKEIVRGADIKILGGLEDPLITEQIPQWEKINELIKRGDGLERDAVVQRTIRKYGHLISADVVRTIIELEKLRTQTQSSIVR